MASGWHSWKRLLSAGSNKSGDEMEETLKESHGGTLLVVGLRLDNNSLFPSTCHAGSAEWTFVSYTILYALFLNLMTLSVQVLNALGKFQFGELHFLRSSLVQVTCIDPFSSSMACMRRRRPQGNRGRSARTG